MDINKLKDEERQRCECWTRVMGYYRPVDSFNVGKKAEYKDRKCYKEPDCISDNVCTNNVCSNDICSNDICLNDIDINPKKPGAE